MMLVPSNSAGGYDVQTGQSNALRFIDVGLDVAPADDPMDVDR